MRTAIWWIRRDVRLNDNEALAAALKSADRVVPVFVCDPDLLASPYMSQRRYSFLLGGLRELDAALRERGNGLVVRRGPPEQELARLRTETKADAIYCEQDVSPFARRRDQKLERSLPLKGVWGLSYLSPRQALKPSGSPYTQFSAYRRAWYRDAEKRPVSRWRVPRKIPGAKGVPSEGLPTSENLSPAFTPGERAAKKRLGKFLRSAISTYAEDRNRLDKDGTSRLSPYLRFGMLSAERAVTAAFDTIESSSDPEARKGAETWLSELIWREFYMSVLYHFPSSRSESFRKFGQYIRWREDQESFDAWCSGRTGYPVVDAGMRELAETGFMHNRARMIVASFLTKHLLLDWRLGEKWFMQNLIDGDPAANNGGWQWTAGTGTDAAPYFRVFNPTLQGKRFDPEGRYVKHWLPHLRERDPKDIHDPVDPIVSHGKARIRALKAFKEAERRAKLSE